MSKFSFFSNRYNIFLFLIIFVSIIFRLLFIHPTFSDENFYFNVAKNLLEGKILYKDFFFAHPPIQVYAIAGMFRLFGTSLLVAKILPIIASSLSVFLVFLISKEFYEEKTALLSVIFFILTPTFLAFSDQGYGMWEPLFFLLLSTYLLVRKKTFFSVLFYTLAVFFRYITLIFFPFLLILTFLKFGKIRKFLLYSIIILPLSSLSFYLLFGPNLIKDTIMFQLSTKIIEVYSQKIYYQYLGIGLFTIFLGLISASIVILKKDRLTSLLSIYPIIADLIVFFVLKTVFYHYFLFSVPFIAIATSRAFMISKDSIIKISLLAIVILSVISNIRTIDFYVNPSYSKNIYFITDYIRNNTSKDDSIFGEPTITNYISFVTGRRIASDYLDSYLGHLMFEGEGKVIQNLDKEKPKFIIEMKNYYTTNPHFSEFINNNYNFTMEVTDLPDYIIYEKVSH